MNTGTKMETVAEASPRFKARMAGVFYLLTIVTGAFAAFVGGRLGSAANLAATICYIVVTALFYGLFKPVNKGLSLVAALFSLVGCGMGALTALHLAAAPIDPLAWFGVYCLLIGYLIFRSTFLPRFLGVLMAFAGLGWVTFAFPAAAKQLSPYNMLPGLLGETVLTVWLLAKGVNAQR